MGAGIGIHLGLREIRVAALRHGKPELIPNREGTFITPAVVAFPERGKSLAGQRAVLSSSGPHGTLIPVMEHFLKGETITDSWGDVHTPEELLSILIRKILQEAEVCLGTSVDGVVISLLTSFSVSRRLKITLKKAVSMAGSHMMRLLSATSAAALCLGFREYSWIGRQILVTVHDENWAESCLEEQGDGLIEILYQSGNFISGLTGQQRSECFKKQIAKVTENGYLCPAAIYEINLDDPAGNMQDEVNTLFPGKKVTLLNPAEISFGAAVQAAKLCGESEAGDILLLDAMGCDLGLRLPGGEFYPVITKGTSIPIHKGITLDEVFQEKPDYLDVVLRAGEDSFQYEPLGRISLTNFQKGFLDQLQLNGEIDANAEINVYVENVENGRKEEIRPIPSSPPAVPVPAATDPVSEPAPPEPPPANESVSVSTGSSGDTSSGQEHYSEKEVILKMLPVYDSLYYGISQSGKKDNVTKGMEAIQKQMLQALKDLGVEPIPALWQEFDPKIHEAVEHVENPVYQTNCVIKELQTGFLYQGELLRPSRVVVAN